MTTRSICEKDRADKYWAWAASAALHVAAALWVLIGVPETQQGQSHAGPTSASLSTRFLGEDEFRQPLVAASPAKPIADPEPDPDPEPGTDHIVVPALETEAATATEATAYMQDAVPASVAPAVTTQDEGISGHEPSDIPPQLETPNYGPLENAYMTALRAAIQSRWTPQNKQGGSCSITIQQMVGGRVISATLGSCMLSDVDRQALEAAILTAQPLPYAGFEQVFREHLTVQVGE
ncbi:cell envelope integrity protein TolA [Pseudoxanthomonas wuyuanensis]